MKVAIQGIEASFHDVAARRYFAGTGLSLLECSTFPQLFEVLDQGKVDYAVMAIENALAASILPNYTLLEKYRFKIEGEVYLKIQMCLLALPGQSLKDIEFVQSHPMALLQCRDFLHTLSAVKLIEHADTAESAKDIRQKNMLQYASIASELAAQTYHLAILQKNIETDRANYTRFLILRRQEDYQRPQRANKSSIRFETAHVAGSLVRVLQIFERYEINMARIQSLPIIGRPFYYGFHVDLEWEDWDSYLEAMEEVRREALNLIEFGEYLAGEKPIL